MPEKYTLERDRAFLMTISDSTLTIYPGTIVGSPDKLMIAVTGKVVPEVLTLIANRDKTGAIEYFGDPFATQQYRSWFLIWHMDMKAFGTLVKQKTSQPISIQEIPQSKSKEPWPQESLNGKAKLTLPQKRTWNVPWIAGCLFAILLTLSLPTLLGLFGLLYYLGKIGVWSAVIYSVISTFMVIVGFLILLVIILVIRYTNTTPPHR